MDLHTKATREEGLARLEAFLPQAGTAYARKRNHDVGPQARDHVSLLSPYLRHRLILEEEVLTQTLRKHSFSAAEKFVQEVFWRTYFKGWLEQQPAVWERYRAEVPDLIHALTKNDGLREQYERAVDGVTGIECFDVWVRELHETGYLHNHTRMWFASIWVFTLGLPWQLGADLFYRHLLDGDPASNTLSWRWVCGLHTKGKTYLARADNIRQFTDGRFNPEGQLAPAAPALQEKELPPRRAVPELERVPDGEPFILLMTEEDCYPESLPLPGKPAALIGLLATDARSPIPVGGLIKQFANGAVQDALDRASVHFDLGAEAPISDDWAGALIGKAQEAGVKTVVTAYAPVSPVAERLAAARKTLEEQGLRLYQVRRAYDEAAWPHANKGFFGLKAKIPALLQSQGLSA